MLSRAIASIYDDALCEVGLKVSQYIPVFISAHSKLEDETTSWRQ